MPDDGLHTVFSLADAADGTPLLSAALSASAPLLNPLHDNPEGRYARRAYYGVDDHSEYYGSSQVYA